MPCREYARTMIRVDTRSLFSSVVRWASAAQAIEDHRAPYIVDIGNTIAVATGVGEPCRIDRHANTVARISRNWAQVGEGCRAVPRCRTIQTAEDLAMVMNRCRGALLFTKLPNVPRSDVDAFVELRRGMLDDCDTFVKSDVDPWQFPGKRFRGFINVPFVMRLLYRTEAKHTLECCGKRSATPL